MDQVWYPLISVNSIIILGTSLGVYTLCYMQYIMQYIVMHTTAVCCWNSMAHTPIFLNWQTCSYLTHHDQHVMKTLHGICTGPLTGLRYVRPAADFQYMTLCMFDPALAAIKKGERCITTPNLNWKSLFKCPLWWWANGLRQDCQDC